MQVLGRGYAWLDTGTIPSLFEAANFVRTIELTQGLPVSVVEEIAYNYGWITKEQLLDAAQKYGKSSYGKHLLAVAQNKVYSAKYRSK